MTYSTALKRGAAVFAIALAMGAAGESPAKTPIAPPIEQPLTDKPALDLKAHNIRNDRQVNDTASLRISNLDVHVDIAGHMAQTTLTMTFANPTGNRLEGDFSLQLPADAYVTGYALDVNGQMIEGVLQSKIQAREAYEERLRAGVDPGLAEIDARNMFRTHVFPILPGSGRTIRVSYVTPLGADGRYNLPLSTAYTVGKATFTMSLPASGVSIMAPPGLSFAAPAVKGDRAVVSAAVQDVALTGNIVVDTGATDDHAVLTRHKNGESFFEFVVPAEAAASRRVKTLRLYWDASRSHRDDDTEAEARLVAAYIASVRPQAVDLVLFGDDAPKIVHFADPAPEAIRKALTGADYAGATRFNDLEKVVTGRADVCLLVSDGRMTLGDFEVKKWPCRVLSLSASTSARRDVLRTLSTRNGGLFVDLAAGHDSALKQLLMRGPRLDDLSDASGAPVDYAILPMGEASYRIFGPAPRDGKLVAGYGETTHDYVLPTAIAHDGAGALWGAAQLDRLNATDAPDREKVLALARRYSIATPDVSFIVLETGRDYAAAKIAPPAGIDKAIMADYVAERDRLARDEVAEKASRFDKILDQWNAQKIWYSGKYKSLKEATKKPMPPAMMEALETPPSPMVMPAPMAESAPPPPPVAPAPVAPVPQEMRMEYAAPPAQMDSRGNTEVVVTGMRARSTDNDASGGLPGSYSPPSIEVSAAEWNPDRPYLKALAAVKADDAAGFDATYSAMEKAFGDTPGFYFDVAEWLFRKGDAKRAAAVARNALELPASDLDTRIILAGRLARYGDDADAIRLDEGILAQTPEKPQAARNLALALIDATDRRRAAGTIAQTVAVADYKRALGLLMKVVLTPWDSDYDGIELISLMEANHLVARMKSLGVTPADLSDIIDPRLVALMDVDIRITLEWNTDKTDMDLWVDEPTGERVVYNNPKSQLGGRLSNNMTQGYGPEEYLLRVAPLGEYSVQANVYAADTLNRNGATSVTVRLYRDWGRSTEKMESFVIELEKGERGTKLVGKFKRK